MPLPLNTRDLCMAIGRMNRQDESIAFSMKEGRDSLLSLCTREAWIATTPL